MSGLVKFDGLDDAIIGVATRLGSEDFIVYSRKKCIEILMNDMSRYEAEEYFDFNVAGAWAGDSTPAFLDEDLDQNYAENQHEKSSIIEVQG